MVAVAVAVVLVVGVVGVVAAVVAVWVAVRVVAVVVVAVRGGPVVAVTPLEQALASVEGSKELHRILNIPGRDPDELGARIAGPLTDMVKVPGGTWQLRPLQALAIAEAHDYGGLLGLLPVGGGKTLVTALIPVVVPCKRPLLIVPAKLVDKTHRDFVDLRTQFKYHPGLQVVSYELISRRPDLLIQLTPDLIIADECHKLKNTKAGVTRRVWRYLRTNPDTRFVGLSGTVTKRSFKDWWHLQRAALPPGLQPLPQQWKEMDEWCQALDTKIISQRRLGALSLLGGNTVPAVRTAYGVRLRQNPGVISQHTQDCDASIQVAILDYKQKQIQDLAQTMRATWETPDGDPFSEASDLWRHMRELANGFYYKWREPGPLPWMDARREFHRFVRDVLKHSRKYDTMLQVVRAHPDAQPITTWRKLRDTFKPVTEPVWFTDDVLKMAKTWADKNKGLVWVEHTAVGFRLERTFGLKYFGRQGMSSDGSSIRDHQGAAAVSALAVSEGFNLQQHHSDNLILNATPSGMLWEQMLGRTHRYGQQADVVTVDVLAAVPEQLSGFKQALADAAYIQQTTHQPQKLMLADITNANANGDAS